VKEEKNLNEFSHLFKHWRTMKKNLKRNMKIYRQTSAILLNLFLCVILFAFHMNGHSKQCQYTVTKHRTIQEFRINCVCVNIYMYICTPTYIRPYVQGCENIHQPTDRICCRLEIRSAFPARWIGALSKVIPQSFRGLRFTEFLESRHK